MSGPSPDIVNQPPPRFASARPLRGIALKLCAVGVFSTMGALVKSLGDTMPIGQLVFARSLFALIPIGLLVAWGGGWRLLRTAHPIAHVRRSSFGCIGMFSGFTALTLIPLVDAVAINFATPLFITALAAVLLGEPVRVFRWTAVVAGLVGVLIILSPGFTAPREAGDLYLLGAGVALGGTVFSAMAMISIRRMADTERAEATAFYFTMTCLVLSGLTLPFAFQMPASATQWGLLISIGMLGGFGQILMTHSYRFVDASTIAPFDYTAMLFAVTFGYLVFDEVPKLATLIGASIVIASGLAILLRERQLGRRRGNTAAGGGSIP